MTNYTVLRRNQDGDYELVGQTEANASEGAIRKLAKTAGSYVAVPTRSFALVNVQVEQPAPIFRITAAGETIPE